MAYEIINTEDSIINEALLYSNKRAIDGQKAFFELMAELRLNSIQNNYPREVNKFIERKLKNVRDEVILGQWLSAKEYLDEVTVESYLTQQLWDRINLKLTTYIDENY